MRLTTSLLVVGALLLMVAPGGAGAQAPSLDQYIETVPGAGGNKATKSVDNKGGGSGSGGSSTAGLEGLAALGEDGAVAASAASATAPSPRKGVRYALALLAEEYGGQTLSDLYDSRGTAAADLSEFLVDDEDVQSGIADRASRLYTGKYWTSEVPTDVLKAGDGDAPLAAVVGAVSGGDSGGVALPILLGAVLLGGLVLAVRRRRDATGS